MGSQKYNLWPLFSFLLPQNAHKHSNESSVKERNLSCKEVQVFYRQTINFKIYQHFLKMY